MPPHGVTIELMLTCHIFRLLHHISTWIDTSVTLFGKLFRQWMLTSHTNPMKITSCSNLISGYYTSLNYNISHICMTILAVNFIWDSANLKYYQSTDDIKNAHLSYKRFKRIPGLFHSLYLYADHIIAGSGLRGTYKSLRGYHEVFSYHICFRPLYICDDLFTARFYCAQQALQMGFHDIWFSRWKQHSFFVIRFGLCVKQCVFIISSMNALIHVLFIAFTHGANVTRTLIAGKLKINWRNSGALFEWIYVHLR